MPSNFFDESEEQSAIKTAIVSKYFMAWAQVIIPSAEKHDNRIAYIDLFCGPDRYKDGTESTPIQILKAAAGHPKLSQMLVTMFNDLDHDNVASLQSATSLALKILPTSRVSYDGNSRPPQPNCKA